MLMTIDASLALLVRGVARTFWQVWRRADTKKSNRIEARLDMEVEMLCHK
jgi:hypothetical protein